MEGKNILEQAIEKNIKIETELLSKHKEKIEKAMTYNKFGSAMIKANKVDKAIKAIESAISQFQEGVGELGHAELHYTNAYFNLAKAYSIMKMYKEAIHYFEMCIEHSPFKMLSEGKKSSAIANAATPHFNSFDCLVEAYSELAIAYYTVDEPEKSHTNCMRALALEPGKSEAIKTLGNVLRQMNRTEEAIDLVWNFIEKAFEADGVPFESPKTIHCKLEKVELGEIHIVCVKYGTLYGSEYVNKLYNGFKKHLSLPHDFSCFTDNPTGLESAIKIVPISDKYKTWWSKANIFNRAQHEMSGRIIYMDLDMIISGSLDKIATYQGEFGILGVENIYCEKRSQGYNSSIMIFDAGFGEEIFNCLEKYSKYLWQAIVRFDFFLEMMVKNADILQKLYPGEILDYVAECKGREALPEKCRVVCFPRDPKPHECGESWVRVHWFGDVSI